MCGARQGLDRGSERGSEGVWDGAHLHAVEECAELFQTAILHALVPPACVQAPAPASDRNCKSQHLAVVTHDQKWCIQAPASDQDCKSQHLAVVTRDQK
eukprot:1194551-Prorocentrum_minimum.AAC.1